MRLMHAGVVSLFVLVACSGGDDNAAQDAQADTRSNDATSRPDVIADATIDVVPEATADASDGSDAADTCVGCVVISSGAGTQPHGIFVDATNVYWTNEGTGTVMQAKTDGTSVVTLATAQDHPIAVAVLSGNVYWGNYSATGTVQRVPIGGGTIANLGPAVAMRNIVVNASYIWWTNEPDDIQRMPITGVPDGGTSILLSSNLLSEGLALDATNIYWANRGDGYVKKADLDESNETQLAVGDIASHVAVNATRIFWTEAGSTANSGKVTSALKVDGSSPVPIATSQGTPYGIAIDSTSVYWANFAEGTINKAPLGGGSKTVIASALGGPTQIAVDSTSVYWVEDSGNRVMKAPK